MKRDDALTLVEFLNKDFNRPGTRTSRHHGYNAWTSFIVRETTATLQQAQEWDAPGLFIANADITESIKPYVTCIYKMGCGTLLVLVLPKHIVHGEVKVPNNFIVMQKGVLYGSEPGFKIALQNWTEAGTYNELVANVITTAALGRNPKTSPKTRKPKRKLAAKT